jgi:hypothetical protein
MKHVTLDEFIAELQALKERTGGGVPVVLPGLGRGYDIKPLGVVHEARLGKGRGDTFVSRGGVPCIVISDAIR